MKKVFVNSLPKAGTNLLAKCLERVGYEQAGGFASSNVLARTIKARVRRRLWRAAEPGYIVGIDTPVEVARVPVDRRLRRIRGGQFAIGHIGYTVDLLRRIESLGFTSFLIIRDPRAVLNSLVHYLRKNQNHPLHRLFISMSELERYQHALHGVQQKRQ